MSIRVKQNYRLPPEEEARRKELYDKGLTDSEIAKELGYVPRIIQQWRMARDLPSNYKREKRYGSKLVRQCEGCIHANLKKNWCNIFTEPGYFWREGNTCWRRREKEVDPLDTKQNH